MKTHNAILKIKSDTFQPKPVSQPTHLEKTNEQTYPNQ